MITGLEIFYYRGAPLQSLKVSKHKRDASKTDNVKYLLEGRIKGGAEVTLVKAYYSGMLVYECNIHVQFLARKVKDLWNETI